VRRFVESISLPPPVPVEVFTTSMALLLVTFPAELLTMTEYADPLIAVVVADVVYELAFAPLMLLPFILH
jgi:hypothetical protein